MLISFCEICFIFPRNLRELLHPQLVHEEFEINHDVVDPLFGCLARAMTDIVVNVQQDRVDLSGIILLALVHITSRV